MKTEPKSWSRMPCVGLDFEATGVDATADRIVSAALVVMPYAGRPTVRTWLAKPTIPIPAEATAVHGITTEHAETHGRPIDQVLFELTGILGLHMGRDALPLVAYNAAYDVTLLEWENRRHGVDTLESRLGQIQPVLDPLVLDKHADPYRKGGRKLTDVCRAYQVVHGGPHDAAADAIAACRLWPRILERHPRAFVAQSLPGLHVAQSGWRRAQMESLRGYFDRKGITHDGCDPSWPVRRPDVAAVAS